MQINKLIMAGAILAIGRSGFAIVPSDTNDRDRDRDGIWLKPRKRSMETANRPAAADQLVQLESRQVRRARERALAKQKRKAY